MPFGDYYDRMQSHRLETTHVEHGHIEACPEFPANHLVHEADPLTGRLKTGRDGRVGDSLGRNGVIQGGHLLLHTVGVARLILV